MSKSKKIILILAILIAIVLSFIGGQTFSKYITEVKGQGIAEVARWSFKVNGKSEEVQTINLASTCNNETLINNKIAPGTEGAINIIIDGTGSDVGIEYNVKFENEMNKPQNLKFMYNEETYNSITELEDILTGVINANAENKVTTLTVNWEWEYETGENENEILANDKIDTQNAQDITNYTFDIIVSGTQVMPNA